jgi:hypothetical protein
MAKIIPTAFRKKEHWVLVEQRGKVIEFYLQVEKPARTRARDPGCRRYSAFQSIRDCSSAMIAFNLSSLRS